MVAMVVGDQDIIEPFEARLVRSSPDSIGVAAFVTRPSGVD
jgi:hypothetical protein